MHAPHECMYIRTHAYLRVTMPQILPSGLDARSSRICSMKYLLRPYGLVIPTPTFDDSSTGDAAFPYTVADDEKIKLRHPCVSRACSTITKYSNPKLCTCKYVLTHKRELRKMTIY